MARKPYNPAGVSVRRNGAAAPMAPVARYTCTPAASAATAVASGIALTAAAQTGVTAGLTSPAVARALSVVGTAAGMTGNVVVYGRNMAGEAISETFTLNGTTAVNGAKAFAAVDRVDLPVRNAAGDTVNIGTRDVLGLPAKLPHNTVIFAFYNNTREGTAPTVAVSASALEANTFDLSTNLAGAVVDVYFAI